MSRDSGESAGEQILSEVLIGTRGQVEGGRDAFRCDATSPKVFDALYVNMSSRRTGGILDPICSALDLIEKNGQAAASRQIGACYPVGVLTVAGGGHHIAALESRADFATLFAGLALIFHCPRNRHR